GLMRTDRGGPDAPFDARILTRNFLRIAAFDEYAPEGADNHLVARQTPDHLRRWSGPVHMALTFDPMVPEAKRVADTAYVTAYAARLAALTGLTITVGSEPGNFHIFVLDEDARRAIGPELRRLIPGIGANVVATVTQLPVSTYCTAFAFSQPGRYTYDAALAVIRGEHPDLMRKACYDEELAQSLGPANDSPEARPSIFNDDQEYALLTRQDALMLRMLYDPRLRPGMTAAEAAPIARQIANELLGEPL
ncbi:DUF2927 domain-containing protein, partial [Thioclava sp. BHET1]